MKRFGGRKSPAFLQGVHCWLVPGLAIWAATEASVAQTTNAPLVTIRQFLDDAHRWNETNWLRLQGVVTASLSDKTYFLQDGDAGVYIFHRPPAALRVGEWVEVTGHPSLGGLKPLLDGSAVRKLGMRELPAAVTLTFPEVMSAQYHMRLIRIRGRLAEERLRGGAHLVLNAGGSTNSFVADLEALPDYELVSRIQPGSLLDVTGVCNLRTDATHTRPVSLTVYARSGVDVAVVSGPPWWTRKRMLAMLGIALGGLSLALVWGWTLRREVRRQTLSLRQEFEQRRAADMERLRASEALQVFIDSVPGYVSFVDAGEHYHLVNPSYEQWFGRKRPEIVGRRLNELHSPAAYQRMKPFVERALRGELVQYESCVDDTAGEAHWFDIRYIPRKASDGSVAGFFVLVLDVTAKKQAEAALRESRERLDNIVSSLDDVVWSSSADGSRILFLNAAAATVYGRPTEDLYTDPRLWLTMIHPEDRERISDAFGQAIHRQDAFDFEYRIVRPDGSVRWLRNRTRMARDSSGNAVRIDGLASDITARKQAEEERANFDRQIQQAQKLESLGVLAGGIAHDFNNLLTAVMGNVSLAMVDLPPESPLREPLLEAEKATHRAADLARQMLAYSGRGSLVIQRVQLSSVVKEMVSMLQVSISKRAMLRVNCVEDQPAIEADVTQLRQIVLNLVINASDAIGEKSGAIAVSTGVIECDQAYLKTTWLKDPLREGPYVYLEVADSGCGIAPEQLSKIFDPFFTTKFAGRGLGLAAVLGIVRGHKGAIKVHSEAGQGTSFTVLFPVAGGAPNLADGARAGKVDWRGSGLILLVDDEAGIRDIGKRMLQRLGFEVIVAADGRDALAQIREHGDRITTILLDLTMPHMDGEETFRELHRIRTDIPVVLSSGYSKQDVVEQFAGKGIAGFVPKPYTMDNLQSALQPLLASGERPPGKSAPARPLQTL